MWTAVDVFVFVWVCLGLFLNDRKETIDTWRHKQKREDIELQYKRRYETSATGVEKTQVMQLKKKGAGVDFRKAGGEFGQSLTGLSRMANERRLGA